MSLRDLRIIESGERTARAREWMREADKLMEGAEKVNQPAHVRQNLLLGACAKSLRAIAELSVTPAERR